MRVSTAAYEQGKLMLMFVEQNPMCDLQAIADSVGALKASAHHTVKKMVDAEVLTSHKQTCKGGYHLLYQATGKAMPEREPIKKYVPPEPALTIKNDAVSAESLIALPSFIRAITPVMEAPAISAVTYNGHTKEQHIKQSEIMRQERRTRGAMYTGVARL